MYISPNQNATDPHLSPGALSALLDALLEVQLEMVLCNAATRDGPDPTSSSSSTTTATTRCYCWRLRHRYDFRSGGQARLTLQQHVDAPCAHPPTFLEFVLSDLNWYNPLVAALAALYLTLLCKALAASVAVYLRARRSFEAHAAVGTSHPLTQRCVIHSIIHFGGGHKQSIALPCTHHIHNQNHST